MYHRRCWSLIPALALAFTLVACDSDSTGPDGSLSEQEVESMMEALAATGGFLFSPFTFAFAEAPSALLPPAANSEHAQEFDLTLDCPVSGTVQLAGEVSSSEQAAGYSETWSLTQTHTDCVATAQSDGSQWTFNGDPNLSVDATWFFEETESGNYSSLDMTQTGGFAWAGQGMSGSCQLNVTHELEVTESQDGESFSISYSAGGTVCGHPVSIDFSASG